MVCKPKSHSTGPGKEVNEAVFFLLHMELYVIFNHKHGSIRIQEGEC